MKPNYTVEQLQALLIEHDGGVLKQGSHKRGKGDEFCGMEFVAKLAGEPWTDDPQCSHPVLSAYVRQLNDSTWASDAERTRVLLPLIARVFGTRDLKISVARIAEATIREVVPLALESAASIHPMPEHAARLREAAQACRIAPADAAARAAAYAADAAAARAAAARAADAAARAADAAYAADAAAGAAAYAARAAAYAAAGAAAYAARAGNPSKAYEVSVALVIAEIHRAEKE